MPPVCAGRIEALTEMASIGSQVSLGCSKYAVPALCYAAFPPCTDQQPSGSDGDGQETRQRPLGICRNDCQRLTNVACKAEYDFARRATIRIGTITVRRILAISNINIAHISYGGCMHGGSELVTRLGR